MPEDTLIRTANGRNNGSPAMVLRAARAAGLTVEQVLSPRLTSADTCPTCGMRRAS